MSQFTVLRQIDADHYELIDRIPFPKGAATSLFVPDLERFFSPCQRRPTHWLSCESSDRQI